MLVLIIAGLAESFGTILEKYSLSRVRLSVSEHLVALHTGLALVTVLVLPWFGSINLELAIQPANLFKLVLVLVIAAGWNLGYAKALKAESLDEFEAIILIAPLATIILSALFLNSERDGRIILASSLSVAALFWAHIKRHHLVFKRSSRLLFGVVGLMAVEVVLLRQLLDVFSPAVLYVFRTGFVALIIFSFFRPRLNRAIKHWPVILGATILFVVFRLIQYTAFVNQGVVYSTGVLVLSPFLVLVADNLILKEKIQPRQLLAIFVIVASIVYATVSSGRS